MPLAPFARALAAKRRVAVVDALADLTHPRRSRAALVGVGRGLRTRTFEHGALELVLPRLLTLDRLEVGVRRRRRRRATAGHEQEAERERTDHRSAK